VIDNPLYKLVTDPNTAYLKNNTEAIWQLQATGSTQNTLDGNMFIRNAGSRPNATEPSSVAPALVRSFETGDKRKTSWIDSVTTAGTKYYFPRKYDIKSKAVDSAYKEYLVVLRLAEQYLIRAEARAKLSKTTEAAADINTIRTRAGLANTAAASVEELLAAVEQERKIELMVEWGHRWLDLKRTNRVNDVMSVVTPLKGGTWTSNMQLWPVPSIEITLNPNLAPQNPGYN
jgi:starch-binding outer membrane protein, SusD/RagB family